MDRMAIVLGIYSYYDTGIYYNILPVSSMYLLHPCSNAHALAALSKRRCVSRYPHQVRRHNTVS